MTAATIEASTGPQIRNRAPVVNATSITPGSIGTSTVNDANRRAPCNCRRQRNSWLACIPASRATVDATAPGSIAAATMRSFSALDHLRRCRTEVTISAWVFVIGPPQYPLSEPADHLCLISPPNPPSPPAFSLTNGKIKPTKIARHSRSLRVRANQSSSEATSTPLFVFALVLYQPKVPQRIHGLSAVI
jgi:hypothetical protein